MSRFQRIAIPLDSSPDLLQKVVRGLRDMIGNLADIFDKGIGVLDNLDVTLVSFTSNGVADTEDAVTHTLGRIPVGYMVASQDKAGAVYVSGTPWTATTIYVKTSTASVTLKLLLY